MLRYLRGRRELAFPRLRQRVRWATYRRAWVVCAIFVLLAIEPVRAGVMLSQPFATPSATEFALTGTSSVVSASEDWTRVADERSADRREVRADGNVRLLSARFPGTPGEFGTRDIPDPVWSIFAWPSDNDPAQREGFGFFPAGQDTADSHGLARIAEGQTLWELLKLYVNVTPSRRAISAPNGNRGETAEKDGQATPNAHRGQRHNRGILDALLETSANEGIGWLIAYVLQPTLGIDGLVSFSIVGFGNFAIMMSVDRQRIDLIDLVTGRSVEIAAGGQVTSAGYFLNSPGVPGDDQRARAGLPSALALFVKKIIGFILRSITDPFKISLFILLVVIWGLWQVHSHDA